MCKLRCPTLRFVGGRRPHMRDIVFKNTIKKMVFTNHRDGKFSNFNIMKNDLQKKKKKSPPCIWTRDARRKPRLLCITVLSSMTSITIVSFVGIN